MWTRLLFQSSLKSAFAPQLINGKWIKPPISNRYKQMLRKEFRLALVPWPLEVLKKKNPRNKKPKGHKAEQIKVIKLEKIKKMLTTNDDIMLKYRQEKLNSRKLKGVDKLVSLALPSWISFDREEYMAAQKDAEKKGNNFREEGEEKGKKKKFKKSNQESEEAE